MSAAYEAWGFNGRKPELLGVAVDKGGCDRIHRRHEVGGITVRGGIVVAVFPGTGKGAVAELRRAAEAAHRERGDLPAPAEVERERLRLVAPAPEEPAGDEDDEESGSTNDPDDADCDDEEEVTTAPSPGAQEHEFVKSNTESTTNAPGSACPVPGCGKPPARTQARTAPELADLCPEHRKAARGLCAKLPEYTPAHARVRILTGKRPAALGAAPTAAERGARGGKARAKTLRPAVAETVRSVPAVAPASVLVSLAPAGSPLGERVAVVRRLVACEARAGGVEVVEQLVELAARCGGAGELAALVAAVLG